MLRYKLDENDEEVDTDNSSLIVLSYDKRLNDSSFNKLGTFISFKI